MPGSIMLSRRGFTLIELLVVLVVVGLLVMFAIPRLSRNKEKTVIATMESDLRNLAMAEEGYYYISSIYSTNSVTLNATLSTGNTLVINEATSAGWSATLSNPLTPQSCYLFHGSATPVGSATQEGVISCS
ncbi:MAG: prepilin-type N-terminal cleavage/methylation domain-containing protein [Gemmatimonadota bacterium]